MRKNAWKLAAVLACVAIIYAGWRILAATTNPVLFINEDPGATVLIDGQAIKFERGTWLLSPWRDAYTVEIRNRLGTQRRRIYPLAGSNDSSSVVVEKKQIAFNIENEVIK